MRAHRLKSWPTPFAAIKREDKSCDIRRGDRDYRVGDFLLLAEFDPQRDELTGAYLCREITHITGPADVPRGLVEEFLVLSLRPCMTLDERALLRDGHVEWLKPAS